MTDKNVQRNVRSSGEEGIKTPAEKHSHTLSEKGNIPSGFEIKKKEKKENLLDRFRKREKIRKKKARLEEKEGK